jgi:hypothetical protein
MSTQRLALGATLVDGLIAGVSLGRSVVELPAFARIGADAWAAYSREADLRNGRFWYPALAIGGTALTLIAATRRRAMWPAAVLAAAGLLATAKAGPNVLRISRERDARTVQTSFEAFRRWHGVRAALQGVAFVASVVALR